MQPTLCRSCVTFYLYRRVTDYEYYGRAPLLLSLRVEYRFIVSDDVNLIAPVSVASRRLSSRRRVLDVVAVCQL